MFISNGSLITTKTPLSLTDGTAWFDGMPGLSSNHWPSAYAGIFSRQLWVYVVVSKLAKATARLPLPVYQRGTLDRTRTDDHPMAKLLRRPNPGQSGYDLMLWTSSMYDIYGDAFWLKKREGGGVVGLYPLHPTSMNWDAPSSSWKFDNGSLRMDDIKDADLVHFRAFHPTSNVWGMSPLEPLRSTLENEWSARVATSSFWQRGARPGMALSHPGTLSEPAQHRLKAQMDDVAAGADKTGVTVVLEEGMTPQVMTLTAEEAQYIETRKLNREEVCAAYDVPPPVVHILDRATFSNITEQMRSMYRDTMGSRLPAFEAAIEVDLRAAEWPNDDVYAEFLMDEVLRGDFETRQDALNKASHMTIAEKRKIENLPFIEGTDRIFLNTATMPLDAIDAQAQAIAQQTAQSDNPLADVIPLSSARSVMGRLSWQQTLDQVDARSLMDGLDSASTRLVQTALDAERAVGGDVKGLRHRLRAMSAKDAKTATMKAPELGGHGEQIAKMLADFFETQGAAVLDTGDFDSETWDEELSGELHALAVTISATVGKSALRALDYDPSVYDVGRTVDFLKAVSDRLAGNINATTRAHYEAALSAEGGDPAAVFAMASESRAPQIATGVATMVGGFAMTEAGRRVEETDGSKPTKTWITGSNARPEHAAMSGETVGIDEEFSNGMKWPGESGDVDQVAGCNCSVEVSF